MAPGERKLVWHSEHAPIAMSERNNFLLGPTEQGVLVPEGCVTKDQQVSGLT